MPNTPAFNLDSSAHRQSADRFAATRWTLVLQAAHGSEAPGAAAAMVELCQIYWYPLYAYIRRRGSESHEAEDLTQEFFARLLANDSLASVDREKGKFRSFLLASLKHFLANEWDRSQAQKRGGRQTIVSLDALSAENRFRSIPADNLTPERYFERQWALAILEQALERLRAEFVERGKGETFDALKGCLTDSREAPGHAAIATQLGISEGAAKVAAHRMRRRYGELLREEIAHTVAGPDEVEEEIRHLLSCL